MTTITIPRETFDQIERALDIGLDCAQEVADNVHQNLKGYKPHRHAAVDADVATVTAALSAAKAVSAPKLGVAVGELASPEYDQLRARVQPTKLQVTLVDNPVHLELAQYKRMFEAACVDLGLINEALGLDPNDGGSEPILDAIAELKAVQPQAQGEVSWNLKYADSTPKLNVGHSAFEDWFQQQPFATQIGVKQMCRDAYAAGMGDPLVTYAHPQASEPAGWKLVPVEPTPEMCDAGANYMNSPTMLIAKNAHSFYKAMIKAAPKAEN